MLNGHPTGASDPIREYRRYLTVERGLSNSSLNTYETTLRMVAAKLGKTLDQLTLPDVQGYVYSQQTVTKAPRTVARERSTLKGFYHWLRDGHTTDRTTKRRCAAIVGYLEKLKTPKSQRLPRTLTQAEVDQIRQALQQQAQVASPNARRRNLRDRAIFELLITTAIRKSELLSLKGSDVIAKPDPERSEQTRWWLRVLGKGNKERMVPLMPSAVEVLQRYLASRSPKADRLFELSPYTINLIVSKTLATAGISKRLRVHDLRHSAVSLLIQRGVPIAVVRELAGHASIQTTQLYTHLSPDTLWRSLEQCRI